MTKIVFSAMLWSSILWSQENVVADQGKRSVEQLQAQLKIANEHISQLEDRIKLMTLQQQGAIQFFTAGQQLCELDKKQSAPQIQH